jgi:hypothetical protein
MVDDNDGFFKTTREDIEKRKIQKRKKLQPGESEILPNEAFERDDTSKLLWQLSDEAFRNFW